MSSSKLRLGKGTRTTANLTEKQQIELAIALSLQQQQHQTECPQEQEQQLQEGALCHAPEAAADQPNAGVEPLLQEPRSRRAAAARRKFMPEDSDEEDSQMPSSSGADDYEPEPSSSDTGSGSKSDFAGDGSDDERPRKRKKAERTTAKKDVNKPPIGRKKAEAASKASAGASLRDAKHPGSAKLAASRGRKAPAAAAVANHGPSTATSAQGSQAAAPPVRARQVERTTDAVEAAAVHVTSSLGFEPGHGGVDAAGCPHGRFSDGCDVKHEHVEDPPCTGVSVPKPAQTAKGASCGASVGPKGPGAPAKAAPKQVIEPKKAPLHAAASANVINKVTTVPTSKPLGRANAVAASAPFRPPFSSSGGASAGIKLSTTAVTYRVPGLRRPSGAGVGKNTA